MPSTNPGSEGTNAPRAASNEQKSDLGGNKTMKKYIALALAAVLALGLTACGKTSNSSGDQPYTPVSALDLLESVWSTYGEDEKFSAVGGDFSEENSREDAPGAYDLTDRATVDSALGLPETAMVDQAASLVHMMNANTFTAAAYHCTDDPAALAEALRSHIQQRQWMCGFPDKLAVAVVGEYVVSVFGDAELVDTFMSHLNGVCGVQPVYDEAIA